MAQLLSEKKVMLYRIKASLVDNVSKDDMVIFEVGVSWNDCTCICLDRQDAIDFCKEILSELTDDLP